jgi:hypothetical protein
MNCSSVILAFAKAANPFAILGGACLLAVVAIVLLIRRHQKNVRAELQARGLVSRHRHHHTSSYHGKRNPTLSEAGTGLPPVRQGPPPGPIGPANF